MFFAQSTIFAQAETTATAVSSVLSGRSDPMIILVAVLVLAGLWIWYIAVPRAASDRKIQEASQETSRINAETLKQLTAVTTSMHGRVNQSGTTLNAILTIKKIEIDCFDAIATATNCNLNKQISEMRGVVMAVENGATVT